jgi:hypothetical protein
MADSEKSTPNPNSVKVHSARRPNSLPAHQPPVCTLRNYLCLEPLTGNPNQATPIGTHLRIFSCVRLGCSAFHRSLIRNKNASSTKRDAVMQFYGLPPIGQKQRRPMDGAQFHSSRVGEAGGRLKSAWGAILSG